MNDELVDVFEAAALVGRHPTTIRYWKCVGRLTVAGWRSGAHCGPPNLLFRRADVLAVAAATRIGRPPKSAPPRAEPPEPCEDDREPTEDELAEVIAQQRANLPAWWAAEERRQGRIPA